MSTRVVNNIIGPDNSVTQTIETTKIVRKSLVAAETIIDRETLRGVPIFATAITPSNYIKPGRRSLQAYDTNEYQSSSDDQLNSEV